MRKKRDKSLTLDEYLRIRSEARVATLLFCIYTVLFIIGGVYLVLQGGRAHLYTSIGMAVYLTLGLKMFIPPFHRKAYLELEQPELKTYPSRKGLLSSHFMFCQLGAYSLGCLALMIVLTQTLSAIPPKVKMIDLPSIETSKMEPSTTPSKFE
ncbi:hypothetical protein [Streptococcus cuniculi]|uniref:Uncharacterized protein n=1 Tax=Streptococcus cuniculi TaxID=1432788 RepID=A0A4Y9JA12_9STRE|nr:hypothetical protein [Streptococcus cuniculi]MBF0778533.1 hypothetical protein [Streptococcus cuniculi]TFU97627.1 hypothetical protein E4T82_07335 [Streptococcus cuniculi]